MRPERLGNIVNFKRGYDLPSYNRIDGPYPIISSSGESGKHNAYKAEGEGIVIGRYGTLGKPYYVNGRYWPHNTALYVTDFKGNHPKYIYYLLTCLGNLQTSDKSTVPGINRNDLHEINIPYIEKIDQKAIAKVLSDLDSKIELNNKINAELEAMAKLIYDYWFVQFDFPDKNGKPYKSSGGKMVYNKELKREIPEGWEAGAFNDIGDIVGGTTPSTSNDKNFTKNGTPWITPKDMSLNTGNKYITRGEYDVTELGISEGSLKVLPKGTILLSSRAPIGYLAIAREKVTTNQGFKSIVPKDYFSTEFCFYTVQLYVKAMIQYASGSTFKEISGATLKMIKIVIPNSFVIDEFTKKVRSIFQQQDILEQENQKLSELRDWLLPMLMNGQVKVSSAKASVTKGGEEELSMAAEPSMKYNRSH